MTEPLPISKSSPILNVVLFQPEIPGNTGAVGRTCVALNAKLWLVRPLGFRVDEKTLRRAGLDYWQHLDWELADHWDDLVGRIEANAHNAAGQSETTEEPAEIEQRRYWYFSRFAERSYTTVQYSPGDVLVFGSETVGLPKKMVEGIPEQVLRIPTTEKVRSLNLATTVGIATFEAKRQFELK